MSESGRRIAVPGKVPDRLRSFFAKRPDDRGHQLAHSSRLGLCRRIIVKVPLQYGHFLRWLVISWLTWDISASARQGRQQKRCGLWVISHFAISTIIWPYEAIIWPLQALCFLNRMCDRRPEIKHNVAKNTKIKHNLAKTSDPSPRPKTGLATSG